MPPPVQLIFDPEPRTVVAEGTRESGRLRALDGLRLIAALMVCAYHYTVAKNLEANWGAPPKSLFPHLSAVAAYGTLGVQLFFLISGFVICMSAWGRSVGDFARSRISRLYPAYWLAVLLISGACLVAPSVSRPPRLDELLVNLTMVQEPLGVRRIIGVDWTLWVEARFYLLFAVLVVWRGLTYRRVVTFAMVWLAASVIAAQTNTPLIEEIVMSQYAPFFVGGPALYLIHRFGSSLLSWGLVVVSWLLGQHWATIGLWHPGATEVVRSPVVIVAIITAAYLVVAAAAVGWLGWARWRWLTVAGALTYPFYLVHEHLGWFQIRLLSRHWGLPHELVLVITVTTMLVLAYLIHRLVEKPLGSRLRRWLRSTPRESTPSVDRVGEPEPADRQISRDRVERVDLAPTRG